MPEGSVFLYLSKLATAILAPLNLFFALLCIGFLMLFFGLRSLGLLVRMCAVTLLYVASLPVVAGWLMLTLEGQYPSEPMERVPQADVAIILGGAIAGQSAPRVATELVGASDRVLHAARLYHAQKVRRILVTGGNLPWLQELQPESEAIRALLIEWGVPTTAIDVRGTSRTTYENALEINEIRQTSGFQSALLVTSAAHMPRALAVFRRAKVPVIPATTDIQAVHPRTLTVLDLIPDAAALAMSSAALREWLGYGIYWLRGYI